MICAFRVSESVEKNRRQLQIVSDRIRLAQARVDKIKGSKKATKVTHISQLQNKLFTSFMSDLQCRQKQNENNFVFV